MTSPDSQRPCKIAPEVWHSDIVLPNQTNNYNTMFGGEVMAVMDKTAAIAALRFCRQPVVTASSERIDFRTPIHAGEIVEALARVIYAGHSSMIVRVHIFAEHPLTAERRLCTTGYFSMVTVSRSGKSIEREPVPLLALEDDQARGEWHVGKEIRQAIDTRRKPG